jgi:hypothetical protein
LQSENKQRDKNIKEKFHQWKEVFAAMLVEIAYKTEGNAQYLPSAAGAVRGSWGPTR